MMRAPNIKNIAKECGLSPSTVCRALNDRPHVSDKAKSKILKACKKLGYTKDFAASALRTGQSNSIAVIMPEFSNELFMEKLYFLKNRIIESDFNWDISFYSDIHEADAILIEALSRRPKGIITSYDVKKDMLRLIAARNVPIVGFDIKHNAMDSVSLDRREGMFKAVNYLIKQKQRKKILLLGVNLNSERGEGYKKAHLQNNLEINNDLIIDAPFGRNLFLYGYAGIKSLDADLRFDAVCCINDACAIGVIKALTELGKGVPEDIPVIGFDNIMVSEYTRPALTTIAQPKEALSDYCVKFLIRRIQAPGIKLQSISLKTSLIIRESA